MGVTRQKKVMIIAGEMSGDLHGAQLVRVMQRQQPEIVFIGMGGAAMAEAGVRILVDAASLSVVGITEVLGRAGNILKGFRIMKQALRRFRPDLLILIDFPDFNLRVARTAKLIGIRVLYYISPQIWAWRTGRVRTIKKRVDHMAVIFPFESRFFRANAVPVTYVGHPLLDHDWPEVKIPNNNPFPVIGFLPGSRKQEIERHFPIMLESMPLINRCFEQAHYLVAPADKRQHRLTEAMMHAQGVPPDVCEIVDGGARAVFPRCHLVLAASGTVTLEAAIAGVPMIVIYKVSPLSYLLGRIMIQVSHISLVNLIVGREIVPELIQKEVVPENIAHEVVAM
ncbi:MAG: lipid-A-disaccharide synthase, partial [Thermodesulfobacteriota bacterium]|nr:lipid-A-disaccharide synthase [Thermodesulfobacteriota bacterium]